MPLTQKITMFTGIIEAVGQVTKVQSSGGRMLLSIDIKQLAEGTNNGDSVAVNGVCLTVCRLEKNIADFDVSTETIQRSTLSKLKAGSKINLERAMSAQGRFGGHFVQGHIDGTASIASIKKEAGFAEFGFETGQELLGQMIVKGSVAVDGISLTVSKMDKTGFSVSLIPTTLNQTIWHDAKVGDAVNVETDVIVKVIQKQLAAMMPKKPELTLDKLYEHGF